jgi:hypothetical protein
MIKDYLDEDKTRNMRAVRMSRQITDMFSRGVGFEVGDGTGSTQSEISNIFNICSRYKRSAELSQQFDTETDQPTREEHNLPDLRGKEPIPWLTVSRC